jgi:N-acetyl-anhydromuramyl-L-alanine amidase AmpD
MSSIDENGMLIDPRVTPKRYANIEHGDIDAILAIVVHQTAAYAKLSALRWVARINYIDQTERAKFYPDRFPVNSHSVGIELVGSHLDDKTYEPVTPPQNVSLQWLVGELSNQFKLGATDIFRHPDVSYKNPGEAAGAKWR